jgi:glucoamylase
MIGKTIMFVYEFVGNICFTIFTGNDIIQVMGSSRNIFISNETCNRQEDIMGKPYINNAVIGNGSILGCISETGELIRLYWPELDCPQQVKKMLTGFFDTRYPNSTIWFSEGDHEVEQCYLTNTNILETVAHFTKLPLKVTQTDFCLPDQPVMIRHYTIKNTGNEDFNLGIGVASHVISSPHDMGNTMFDFSLDALIHYRHSGYWAISSSHLVKEFQIGNNPFGAVWEGKLNGVDSIGMSPDGALLWDMGILQSQHEKSITMYITFSKNLADLKSLTARIKTSDYTFLREMTQNYWQAFLDRCNRVNSGNEKADRIYIRSLLLFQLMTDKNTGGILASPEIDEGFTQCGRYGFCWARDAAFITWALDEAGLFHDTERFYDWVVSAQDTDGFWHQRYHMNGSIAPSWGIQIDETGSVLFGVLNHYKYTKNSAFLHRMWPAVLKAALFLESFIDSDTNLPLPSFDLWEERMGEHTYSTAAVIAGLNAAAEIGTQLGVSQEITGRWRRLATNMKQALTKELLDSVNQVFLRSIRVKLNPWGKEPSENTLWITVNPKGFTREVTAVDATTDVSLLGPAVPFAVFQCNDPVIRNTAERIEQRLTCNTAGGIYRYENDHYIGGNPWIISTLWLALYHIRVGDNEKAVEYLRWTIQNSTNLDLLPEQVSKHDGKPCWVIPLTWSHAMYVLVFKELVKGGMRI